MQYHERAIVAIDSIHKCYRCVSRLEIGTRQIRFGNLGWRTQTRLESRRTRPISTISSVTAVNASKSVPYHFRELHEQLALLESNAGTYVNLSPLKLASRSLESDNAITRVAVLGLDGSLGIRRLVRALLADPLGPESGWEQRLIDEEVADGQGLLIRYSEDYGYDGRHPFLPVLSIPSDVLNKHKTELLISDVPRYGADQSFDGRGLDLLGPSLATPISASGRASVVTYPVHRTLVYGEGVKGYLSSSKIMEKLNDENDKGVISAVVNTQWQARDLEFDHNTISINLNQGESAIVDLRKSLDNSIQYEHEWIASNLSEVLDQILEGTQAVNSDLKPAIERLIKIVLASAEKSIAQEETQQLHQLSSASPSQSIRQELDKAITAWAETAHTELQASLENVLQNRTWRKLTWWKLFWRVDDVGMLTTDILHRSWLVEAEKEIIWVGGRIRQAGLLKKKKVAKMLKSGSEPLVPFPRYTKQNPSPSLDGAVFYDPSKPWSQEISLARYSLSALTIPPLQALSQRLLLQTISTTTLTSILSSLVYFSLSTTSIYEAGTIAALGFVYSFRMLQRKWEAARTEWISHVREEGRKVLRFVEDIHRGIARDGGKLEMDEAGVKEREVAREAVGRVREALEKVKEREEIS